MTTKQIFKSFSLSLVLILLLQFTVAYSVKPGSNAVTPADATDSVTFNFKAQEQSWTVPAGVTQLHIDAYGAQGGSKEGGKGGRVQSDINVTPGSKLIIYVGEQPASANGGYNGGGNGCGKGFGGGGATDIRVGGNGLEHRSLVAGGGGGGTNHFGGGGTGEGGGLIGGDGKSMYDAAHVAKGGTQEAGGAGARAYFSPAGKAGVGGDGINSTGKCTNDMMNGGGGGYYGGGGGGTGNGGGGSSYTNASHKNVSHQQGVNEGNGRVKFYWKKAA